MKKISNISVIRNIISDFSSSCGNKIMLAAILASGIILTGCGSEKTTEVDMDLFKDLVGEYQAKESGEDTEQYVASWWHLSVTEDYEGKKAYVSFYDNSAGNPGVEGITTELDEKKIVIEADEDYLEETPGNWKLNGEYLELEYEITDSGIEFTNNGCTAYFEKK